MSSIMRRRKGLIVAIWKPPVWGVGCNTHILSGRRPFTRPRRSRRDSGFVQSGGFCEVALTQGRGRVCTVVRLWGLFEITGPYRLAICQQRRGTLAHRRQFVARSASQAIAIDSLLRRPTVVALCGSTDSTPSVMIDAGSEMARDDCARHDLAHDVSHRNGDVRGLERLKLCRKRSIMRMTPPQSGQAGTSAHV